MKFLQRLVRWLTYDRVRVPSQTGMWLRLEVGQRIIWRDALWQIAERQLQESPSRVMVHYHLQPLSSRFPKTLRENSPMVADDADLRFRRMGDGTIWMTSCCEHD